MNASAPVANPKVRNVLFIMCDQLRADHLSCYGGAGALRTPNIDRLARMGVQYDRAYVTSAVCGPSRASYYTGRYPLSHRVTWNRVPHPVDEWCLGEHLAQAGLPLHLLGKTHFVPDRAGLRAKGYAAEDEQRFLQGGFVPIERYDGHFELAKDSPYRRYLRERGYDSERPWEDYVVGSQAADGSLASGWLMRNAPLPARVDAADSETAYLTDRALGFMREQGDQPWALHLSYIKPHWPYKAPAPYHALFGADDCAPPVRSQAERERPHPVHGAYQRLEESESFARDEVWRSIRPVYMGLVKQIDDQIGRVLDFLERSGRLQDTLILFTSDHGDHLGDHWLGEKEYFYDSAMRVPCLVYDPAAAADATRGTRSDAFVECIDIVPTVLDALDLPPQAHRVEGRSLLPGIRGESGSAPPAREYVVGSLDYAYREARLFLGRGERECTGLMLRDERYKYLHWQGYRSQLFDLRDDPGELHDLGADPGMAPVAARMRSALLDWHQGLKRRASETDEEVRERTHAHERMMGILIGRW